MTQEFLAAASKLIKAEEESPRNRNRDWCLKFAEYKIRVLQERLRLVRIEKYGPGSEKLSDDQLELMELEPGVSNAEVEAESQREQLQLPLKTARKHPGRQEFH